MANIITRDDAFNASPQELVDFLKEVWGVSRLVFEGNFTTEGIDLTKLRGIVTDVTVEGKHVTFPFTNADFNRISVRKFGELKNPLSPGRCRFSCFFAPADIRKEKGEPFLLTVNLKTIRNINEDGGELNVSSKPKLLKVADEKVAAIMSRLRLEEQCFIGQFAPANDEWKHDVNGQNWIVSDLRNSKDFTKIEDKERGIRNLTVRVRGNLVKGINKYGYFKFGWVLLKEDPVFGFDSHQEVTPMYPQDIVKCLHDSIKGYPPSASKKITRMLDTLNKQLTQSGKEVFIYELLQNANDYPQKKGRDVIPVDVEFHITNQFLMFEHSGDFFNAKNIAAICDINDGEKSDNADAIGYKGIGFKTVFLDNDYVYLHTGNYSFRFENNPEYPIYTPWQILPVWTDLKELDGNIPNIFNRTDDRDFRVKFALRPRDQRILTDQSRSNSYIKLFKDVFETERVILFIPNIRKVSIFFGNNIEPDIVRSADSNKWCVSPAMKDDVPESITERINKVLSDSNADKSDGYDKVPEKYFNFTRTTVKFACQRDGRKLLPVDKAHLYCYLPAKKADWGFKFLMNTDMVPNGERDDIEDIELNHEIAKIAGRQFYYWIKELIACGEYDLDSIFALIPNFKDCIERKSGYSTFIEEFQEEFENLIRNKPFVPCIDKDGDEVEATIDDIINDETGITAKGFMNDTDFISLSNTGCINIPIKELRTSKAFHDFLYLYSPSSNDFGFDDLKSVVSNDDFVDWLEVEHNDVNFISHLLDEDKLSEFADEEIFIEAGGSLFCSKNIYVDFDSNMSRIDFLRDYIPYLLPSLRAKLQKHEGWTDFEENNFKEFDAEDMLKEFILNDDNALETLDEEANSVSFFKFAAEKDIDMSVVEDISFFDEDGNMQSEYGKTYFYSEDVYSLSNEVWLPKDSLYILSHAYFDEPGLNELLRKKFVESGIREFVHAEFIREKLIADVDFASDVNELITDNFEKNLAFVLYAFSRRDDLKDKDNQLKDYVLLCENKDGEDVYLNKDDVRYFSHFTEQGNSSYCDNISFGWITSTMMYALNNDYIKSVAVDQQKALESFLRQSFGVQTFTDKSFWSDVVLKNDDEIYDLIETPEDAISFLSYIVRDRRILLDGSISFKELQNIPLLRADGSVSSDRAYPLYAYDEVAADMEQRSWYTQEFYLLDKLYSEQLNAKELQFLQIESFNIQTVVDSLCKDRYFGFEDDTQCIDFWRWIKAHSKDISDYSILRGVNIHIEGNNGWLCNEMYIPDTFFPIGEGIESLVRKFDENATFVPVTLLEDQTDKCKADWLRLLKKLNAKSDNKAILEHVLNNLGDYEDDSVLALLTKNKKELFDNWSNNVSALQKLLVRTRGEGYLPLNKCIIVRLGEGDAEAEPFKYIVLNREVAPELLYANSEVIMRIAESFATNNILEGRREWANYKIDEYIDRIQDDEEERTRIHTQFIRDLAKWGDSFEFDRKQISKILFRSKGVGRFLDAADLTLGSQYKPACNFEKYHVNLDYLSDTYLTDDNRDLICAFFKENTDIHHHLEKEDIEYMSDRDFSIYVWTVIYKKNPSSIGKWIKDGEFNGVVCIPTAQGVKAPEDLYSPILLEYVRLCNNYTDKIPAIDINKLEDGMLDFMKLPFKTALNSEDCLAFLLKSREETKEENKHRNQIIKWLLENDDLGDQEVQDYRSNPDALWRNGRGQFAHISSLYAIHPDSTQERSVFSANEKIIRTWCFPDEVNKFEDICNMLGIRILKNEDFKTNPVDPVCPETNDILEKLKVRLLILAAIDHEDKYAKYYEKYLEKVTKYNYYSCAQIELAYGDIHGSVGRTYIDETEAKIYYVTAWDNQRTYTKFCHTIKIIAGVNANDDICEEVFDESMTIDSLIDKYCYSLRSDKVFLKYMEDLKQRVIEIEEDVKESDVEEMTYEAFDTDEDNQESISAVTSTSKNNIASETEAKSVEKEDDIIDEVVEQSSEEIVDEPTEVDEPLDEDVSSGEIHEEPEHETLKQSIHNRGEIVGKKSLVAGPGEEVVSEHYRSGTWVDGYYRADGTYVSGHYRSDSIVSEHTREIPETTNTSYQHTSSQPDQEQPQKPQEHKDVVRHHSADDTEQTTRQPRNSNWKREPHNYSNEELDNMRSNGSPLELTTLPPTEEEVEILSNCGISPEKIADSNYVAQLRLYRNLQNEGQQPKESLEEFIRNSDDVTDHQLQGGKYIHTCSAARGVMYISPSIWNKVMDGQCAVCVYYGPHANQFFYIHTPEDLLALVEKDDVVIKITGKEKVNVVGALYNGLLKGVKGTAYTLIRVAAHTEMDAVFAKYVGKMAEKGYEDESLNEDEY